MASIQHVLVVRLDRVGDVVLTVPMLRALRRALPSARITLLVDPAVVDLLGPCPLVDEVVPFDLTAGGRARRVAAAALARARRAVGGGFDLALFPRWEPDHLRGTSPAVAWLSRRRIGHAPGPRAGRGGPPPADEVWLTDLVHGPRVAHEIERSLDVVRALGVRVEGPHALELWTTSDDEAWASAFLRGVTGESGAGTATLAVGASAGRRRWPVERYAEVAAWLHSRYGLRAVLVGGPEDRRAARKLAGAPWLAADATGRASLRQAVALMRRTSLYVGGDTGPMHMAAAVGIPVLAVSCHPATGAEDHENSPARFGPWCPRSAVVRPPAPTAPCRDGCESLDAHCILSVSVDAVLEVLAGLLGDA